MKKYSIFVLCLMLVVFGSVSSALAAETGGIVSGEITIGAAAETATPTAKKLVIGLSPKVSARYINPGIGADTAQWFSMATAHPGGTVIYGTASNLNNIYQKTFTNGTPLTITNMALPGTANSASDWSTGGWSM